MPDLLCPNKERCGSCELSEMPYDDQLTKKLLDINILISENRVICKEIIPSPKTTHYRNKMDYVIDFKRQVGLREKGKWWKVIDGHTCFLADEKIEELFFKVRDWVKTTELTCWDRKTNEGFLRYAVIRATTSGESLLTLVTSQPANDAENLLAETEFTKLISLTNATSFVWSINTTKSDISYGTQLKTLTGEGFITETINDIKYQISSNSFFQTNSHTAKILQNKLVDLALKTGAKEVLDLYCGSGFFTLALAKQGLQVTGVELEESAIRDANNNAILNTLTAEFRTEKAEDLSWMKMNYDLIIVDPTRAGLHPKVLDGILNKWPKNIFYVSCNYKQFSAELPKFLKYYSVNDCFAIDQFPHTNHVELVTWLSLI